MAFRIFISHSSHTEEEREFVQTLAECLTTAGYQVLLDMRQLRASDDWNKELNEWLAGCHAGILLLTPHSVQRPWVLKEATILTWRRSLDAGFKLFPRIFEGVSAEILEREKFAPLLINSIQKVSNKTPTAIAREIAQIIGAPVEVETPLDRLAKVLADLLSPPRAGPSTAENLARKLGIDETLWVPNSPADVSHSRLIAGRILRENLGAYLGVYELTKDLLETMSREFALKALELVAPYWVPGDAAGRLCEITGRGERWAIAMNGALLGEFTVGIYLLRAFPLRGQIYQLKVPGGGSEAMVEETIQDIYAALEAMWGTDRRTVLELLATHPDPLFVVLPVELSAQIPLNRLQGEFPHLTFILSTGEKPDTLDAFATVLNVETLLPAVELNEEKKRI